MEYSPDAAHILGAGAFLKKILPNDETKKEQPLDGMAGFRYNNRVYKSGQA